MHTKGVIPFCFGVLAACFVHGDAEAGNLQDSLRAGSPIQDHAYVTEVFEEKRTEEYAEAADVFVQLVSNIGGAHGSDVREMLNLHFIRLLPLVDDGLLTEVCDGDAEDVFDCVPTPGAGEKLSTWLRSQDPLPATPGNERIQEHLQRVAYALDTFPSHRHRQGYDERGQIYVRFGEPDDRVLLDLAIDTFLSTRLRQEPTVSYHDFPKAEFWVYRRVDDAAHYIFIEQRGMSGIYETGSVNDLVPRRFSGGRHSMIYLDAMRVYLGRLATYHISYSNRYEDVQNFVMLGEPWGANTLSRSKSMTVTSQNEVEDRAIERRREHVPRQSSDVLREFPHLDLQVRTSRFLAENGETRLQMYWSHPAGAFDLTRRERNRLLGEIDPDSEEIVAYIVQMSTRGSSMDYGNHERERSFYRIAYDNATSGSPSGVQSLEIPMRDHVHHVGAQWDGYVVLEDRDGEERIGPQVNRVTFRLDSLASLAAAGLEMSDLKPVLTQTETLMPYPFVGISPQVPLGVFFEIYGLDSDPDQETPLTVTYEVTRTPRSTLLSFLRNTDPESTRASYRVSARGERTSDLIELDFSDWDREGNLEIAVNVRNDSTGEEVRRTLSFQLANVD